MTAPIRFLNLCTEATTDDNISKQATEARTNVHIGFVNLCTACASVLCKFSFCKVLTTDISNQATEEKMTGLTGSRNLCTAVTYDNDMIKA